jgi:hypothetical protein
MSNPGEQDEGVVETAPELNGEAGGFAEGTLEAIQGDVTPESNGVTDEATAEELANVGVNISDADTDKLKARSKREFLRDIDKIGMAYGAGKTSMISLAERTTEAAMDHQIGVDDAEEVYNRFRKNADAKATIDEAGLVPDEAIEDKVASAPQQVSKLRNFIRLGNKMDTDASDVIRRARNIHIGLLGSGVDRKGVKKGSTYTILVAVAREQLDKARAGQPMTDEDLRKFMSVEVAETGPKDGAAKVLAALNAATAARDGSENRAPVDHPALDAAIDNLRQTLGEIAPDRLQALDDEAAQAELDRQERVKAKAEKIEAARVIAERKAEDKARAEAAKAAEPAAAK